jgi:hypothetical protein
VLPNSREAGTTRFFAPEIWVGDSFLEDHKLPTVLAHELAHIRSGDPQIEWYLTLMHCLCWWHPLVWFWVWRARREMELACDEVCADALGQQSYRADLAELIWDSVPLRGGVAMVAGRSFNITRLARLARRPTLNARHRLLIPVACTLALFSVLKIQASTGTVAGEDHTSFVLCPADVESISRDVDGVAASLGLTLSDPAALRMKTQTAGAVGTWLVMVDGGGHALSPTSMTIRAPLEKHVLLRFDVTEDAERLHRYLLGESCDLE